MPSSFYRTLGRNIKQQRKWMGKTQAQAAKRCGISRASIGSIERGEQQVFVRDLVVLAQFLECTIEGLLPQKKRGRRNG